MDGSKAFISTDLDPAELERILQRVDQNLAFRATLSSPGGASAQPQTPGLSPLPDTAGLEQHLSELRRSRAPLFAEAGHGPGRLIRRLLNLPLRALGHKQLGFNRELVATAEQLAAQVHGLRQSVEQLQPHAAQVGELGQTVARLSQELRALREELAVEQRGQHAWIEQVAADQRGQHAWIEQVAADQRGMGEWITLIERKHQMLALDVREQLPSARGQEIPEPRIVDPAAYQARLEAMDDQVRVNLGCGEKPLPAYLNVDYRELPEVDVVADVRRLPFAPGSLAELASAHLVEHFREHQLRAVILPYWRELLAEGGRLRIICPNWAAMLERLRDGRLPLAHFKLLTFGAQDYEGDDHFAMYTPETLGDLLREAGFPTVEVLAEDRLNGICPEMELLAHR